MTNNNTSISTETMNNTNNNTNSITNTQTMATQNLNNTTMTDNTFISNETTNTTIMESQIPIDNANETIEQQVTDREYNDLPVIPAPEFVLATENPNDLEIHGLLSEMGYDNKPDALYIHTMNMFKYYEKPVIDRDNKIITHSADVLAAIANGVTEMEVYKANMTEEELRIFISFKHTYNKKKLTATYHTINFYLNYFDNDPRGKSIAESMPGRTMQKIADFMQTSASTIKRVKTVGDFDISKLGLIEEGYTSFTEVQKQINKQNEADNKAKEDAAKQNEMHAIAAGENTEPYYDENDPSQILPLNTATVTKPVNFTKGTFTLEGIGDLEVSVSDNIPTLIVNGKDIQNLSYIPVVNREESESGSSRSFIITQKGKKGISIQLIVENLSVAA